ncbi:MAG: fumarate hydratase [Victivallales bacterium]|nr:fumarate hydratase [Victivallales bacterium]
MREVGYFDIVERVAEICVKAACLLPEDVFAALEKSVGIEVSELGASLLRDCVRNSQVASEKECPICQDTGFAVFFVEMGEEVRVEGGSLAGAISEGTALGYSRGYLRKSIVDDPVFGRRNTGDNTPPVIHLELVPGDKIRIVVAPKGGGSENMSALAMLKPSDGKRGIVEFAVKTVVEAGGNPCPPLVVGIGVGGTFEKAAILAKKSLLRPLGQPSTSSGYALMEAEILGRINSSGVGPQGLGGSVTALAVHIEHFPCHIASLPVAVNLNCHAARHAETTI